jgi:hypothetical protein
MQQQRCIRSSKAMMLERGPKMLRVPIAAKRGEADSTMLYVRAESIRRALEVAGERNPGCSLNVVFPLDPDTFFVGDAQEGIEAETAGIAA